MAVLDGVEVKIRSENKSLDELDDLEDSQQPDPYVSTKYIEVVTGAKFTITTRLKRNFDFGTSDGVKVEFSFDGSNRWWTSFIPKKGYVYKQSGYNHIASWVPLYCPATKQHRMSEFAFGAIKLSNANQRFITISPTDVETPLAEDSPPGFLPPKILDNLGKIQFEVTRIRLTRRATPSKVSTAKVQGEVSEVPEKLLKGRAISNTVKFALGAPVAPPKTSYIPSKPIRGSMGHRMTFKFLYRSRHALQITGIIPRSPSPEAAPTLGTSLPSRIHNTVVDVDASGSHLEDKIASLQAQLALLKKEQKKKVGIKTEDAKNSNVQHSSSIANSQGRRVKRERAESKLDVNSIQIRSRTKRIRKSDEVETVDLTSD